MIIYTPFTYIVKFKPTGEVYYGSRTKRGCQPSDLWASYYTSSKTVRQLIKEHGYDAFEVEIRRTFQTREQALLWEHRVLRRVNAARNPRYLNKNNGDRKFFGGGVPLGFRHSEDTKRKMSENSKGYRNGKFGKPLSEETKRKLSEAHKGKPMNLTPESREARTHYGEQNGMFGKKLHWYNNGEIQKQFEIHITPPEGWVRGRLWKKGHREAMLASRHPK